MSLINYSVLQDHRFNLKRLPIELRSSILKYPPIHDSIKFLQVNTELRKHTLQKGPFPKDLYSMEIFGGCPRIERERLTVSHLTIKIQPKIDSPKEQMIHFKKESFFDWITEGMGTIHPDLFPDQLMESVFIKPKDFAIFKNIHSCQKIKLSLVDEEKESTMEEAIMELAAEGSNPHEKLDDLSRNHYSRFDYLHFLPTLRFLDSFSLETKRITDVMTVLQDFCPVVTGVALLNLSNKEEPRFVQPLEHEFLDLITKQSKSTSKLVLLGPISQFSSALSKLHANQVIHISNTFNDFQNSVLYLVVNGISGAREDSMMKLNLNINKTNFERGTSFRIDNLKRALFKSKGIEKIKHDTFETNELLQARLQDFKSELAGKNVAVEDLLEKDNFMTFEVSSFKRRVNNEKDCVYLLIHFNHKELPYVSYQLYAKLFPTQIDEP